MKKTLIYAITICFASLPFAIQAEKQNIKVYDYSIPPAPLQYRVNGQGDMVTYQYQKDNDGNIVKGSIQFYYYVKGKLRTSGAIGIDNKGKDYFGGTLTSFEIIGLERNLVLVEYRMVGGAHRVMVFRLVNLFATPTLNKNSVRYKDVPDNVQFGFTNNQIIAITYANYRVIEKKARVNNEITLTTTLPHGLKKGDYISIARVSDDGYNTRIAQVLSTPTVNTFTYLGKGNDEAEASCDGCVFLAYVLDSIDIYNINWDLQKSKGIDNGGANNWGDLYVINLPIQKYYEGVNTAVQKVYILKP